MGEALADVTIPDRFSGLPTPGSGSAPWGGGARQPLTLMYSHTVLDPFAGTGTTLLEAAALDRACVGIECRDAAVALIRAALPDLQILRFE
jgi:hypothetical protein